MTFNGYRLIILLSFVVLHACSNSKDTAEKPVELAEFKPEIALTRLWHTNVGSGTGKYQFVLEPYIDTSTVYIADYEGLLTALDKKNGKRRWQVKTKLPISGGVGGGADLLFVGTRDGRLGAFSQNKGTLVWQANLSSELLSTPVVGLGVVIARTIDGNVQAFSSTSGEKLWSYLHSVPTLSLRGSSRLVISSGIVLSGTDSGQITALSLLEGRVLWETRLAIPGGRSELDRMVDIDGTPLVDEGIIYAAAYQGRIAALSFDQGQVMWARDKSVHLGMSLDKDNLYAVDELSHIWAFERGNGGTIWVQEKLHARPLTPAAAYGDYVLLGDFEGYIHVLAKEDGRFVARMRTGKAGINAAPIVDKDVFYVLTRGGELLTMKISSGKS